MKKGPTPKVQKELVLAAKMRASGFTFEEIAQQFGRSPESIRTWLKRHRSLWQAAYDATMGRAVQEVAELAGSSAVLEIPAQFMAAAQQADAWMQAKEGEPLFPDAAPEQICMGADLTVPAFLESYMIPFCLQETTAETRGMYRKAAAKFSLVMGNPRLGDITTEMLALYRDTLKAMKGQGKSGPLSINTVRTYLGNLQHILDRAGPPAPRRRDAAGYLKKAPWIRLPREELREPKIVSDDVLARCYAMTDKMVVPAVMGVWPGAWWRALLVTGRYLGLRARTIFAMEFDHIDWRKRIVVLPAAILKARKMLVLPLPPIVHEHLAAFRTSRRYVFEYSASREMFRRDFHKLQSLAGVLPHQWFGLHTLRKTAITKLWKDSPSAAQLLAGHGSPLITKMYYVANGEALTDALSASAAEPFTSGNGNGGRHG